MALVYSYYCIGSSLLYFLFGFFCFFKNSQNQTNRLWGLSSVAIATWSLGLGAMSNAGSIGSAQIWLKVHYVGAILVPPFFYHYICAFLHITDKKKSVINFWYALFSGFLFLNLFFNNTIVSVSSNKPFFKYYTDIAPLYYFYTAAFFTCIAMAFNHLVAVFLKCNTQAIRNQIKYMFLATFFGFVGGSFAFLPVYNLNVFPYGVFFVIFYPALMTYAIIKHQLLDIEVIIRRTAVFAGLFAFVYATFSLVTILGQEIFHKYFGWNQWVSIVPTVLIITSALRPLEVFLTNTTERFLFQKKFNYRDLLRTFTNEVLTVLDLQKLTEQTVMGLHKIIKLESASMLLLDKDAKNYKIAASVGVKAKDSVFAEKDIIISYLKESHQAILRDRAADSMEGHSHLKEDFKKINAQLCLPIALHDEMTGVLCLGMKKSGEEYTPEDIDILMTLSRTLAIAIANAQLFDQLSKTQAEAAQREKMAVIGTLAAGINHEICNPLGIVRGQCEMFLLNLRDGIYNSKDREELCQIASDIMNKVIKETDRATGITKRLSGFAKPAKKSESEEVLVEKEVDEVIGLLGHDLKLNNIQFGKSFVAEFPAIFADKKQIQEVLFNIIRNAAQAMDKKDGKIELSGVTQNDMAIIKISDNGSGIPPDKINQIFNPFFTTKEPGKGTGLGLFIVKQVVERNKGTIAVDSQEGVGTTFTLTFPTAQAVKLAA